MKTSLVVLPVFCLLACSSPASTTSERPTPLSPASAGYGSMRTAALSWRKAIESKDVATLATFAENPATKEGLEADLRDPKDPLNQYFFGPAPSMRAFFGKADLELKVFSGRGTTGFFCFFVPQRFKGEWTYELMDDYAVDLKDVLCVSGYQSKARWFVDFDFPIFTGD